MKKSIIFDLDGTLWDSCAPCVIAWNAVLKNHADGRQITVEDMTGYMGKTIDVIGKLIYPELPLPEILSIMQECCRADAQYLAEHGGVLYPALEETLGKLKNNYHLSVVSNSQDGYVQSFLTHHKLWDYFEDIEMAGRTGKQKGENIKLVMERNGLDRAVYVGDTAGDRDAALFAGVPFIYASYGFGILENEPYRIETIADVAAVADKLLGTE